MFFGVRQISGTANLEGDWHALGHTLVFADPSDKPAHERVGRAFAGEITMDNELLLERARRAEEKQGFRRRRS